MPHQPASFGVKQNPYAAFQVDNGRFQRRTFQEDQGRPTTIEANHDGLGHAASYGWRRRLEEWPIEVNKPTPFVVPSPYPRLEDSAGHVDLGRDQRSAKGKARPLSIKADNQGWGWPWGCYCLAGSLADHHYCRTSYIKTNHSWRLDARRGWRRGQSRLHYGCPCRQREGARINIDAAAARHSTTARRGCARAGTAGDRRKERQAPLVPTSHRQARHALAAAPHSGHRLPLRDPLSAIRQPLSKWRKADSGWRMAVLLLAHDVDRHGLVLHAG